MRLCTYLPDTENASCQNESQAICNPCSRNSCIFHHKCDKWNDSCSYADLAIDHWTYKNHKIHRTDEEESQFQFPLLDLHNSNDHQASLNGSISILQWIPISLSSKQGKKSFDVFSPYEFLMLRCFQKDVLQCSLNIYIVSINIYLSLLDIVSFNILSYCPLCQVQAKRTILNWKYQDQFLSPIL